ncbi:hypothetical protein HYX04_04590 [Candidatus Woesearchaeota archaeon]|nr:hypothetical protein [Candidatus Woesearchaeota archaeon]
MDSYYRNEQTVLAGSPECKTKSLLPHEVAIRAGEVRLLADARKSSQPIDINLELDMLMRLGSLGYNGTQQVLAHLQNGIEAHRARKSETLAQLENFNRSDFRSPTYPGIFKTRDERICELTDLVLLHDREAEALKEAVDYLRELA